MTELINSVGVPIVVVLLLLDRVVAIVKARIGNSQEIDTAGGKSTEYWEGKIQMIINESLNRTLGPALERQNTLLEQENQQLTRLNEKMAVMLDRSDSNRSRRRGAD